MDWISKPVALWDWDNPLPPPSVAVTVAPSAGTGDELSGDPLSSVEGSSVVDAQPSSAPAMVVGAPQLGLGLGKRTYFEGEKKGEKKGGGGGHVQGTRCQVEGCGADLSSVKDYHRKHRVCEAHSKCPRVVVAGQERRFCQQCSRFHALSEFDQKKRSCRRRLSDHNARRRKPQPDSFSFGSTRLSSSFYDERRQISFMWNKAPFSLMRQPSWAESDFKISNSNDFKVLNSKEFCIKPSKEGCGQVLQLGSINNNNNINNNNCNPNSSPNPNLVNPNPSVEVDGLSLLEGAPDLRRALSLLSSPAMQNSHATPPPPHPSSNNLLQFSSTDPHSVTLTSNSAAYWMDDQQAASFSVQNGVASTTGGLHLQEFQLLKPAVQYETAAFFDSSQIR